MSSTAPPATPARAAGAGPLPLRDAPADAAPDGPGPAGRGPARADAGLDGRAVPPADAPADAPPRPGLVDTLMSLWAELPGLVSDRVALLTLELQRAGRALAQMLMLVVAAAILGVTAWLALWTGIAVGLVELGLHWSLAGLVVLGLNAGAAWWALSRIRGLVPLLKLPATRRHLMLDPDAPAQPAPVAAAVPATPVGTTAPTGAGATAAAGPGA